MNVEKIFYKYKSLKGESKDNIIKSIKNSYFYFSSPEQLNDNFETYVKLDFTGTDEQKIAWARECISYNQYKNNQIPKEIVNEALKRFSPHTELRKFNKFLTNYLTIKDKDLLKFAIENEKDLKEHNQLFVKNNSLGILSLTSDCLNELMWAHYGNSGFGICLGYALKKKKYGYFMPLEIQGLPQYHGQYIRKVKYSADRKAIRLYDYDNPFESSIWLEAAYYKTDNWKYENEYRCVLSESFLQNGHNYREIKYPKELLKEVIFGNKVEQNDINEIKKIVTDIYGSRVSFYQIKLGLEKIKLDKIPL